MRDDKPTNNGAAPEFIPGGGVPRSLIGQSSFCFLDDIQDRQWNKGEKIICPMALGGLSLLNGLGTFSTSEPPIWIVIVILSVSALIISIGTFLCDKHQASRVEEGKSGGSKKNIAFKLGHDLTSLWMPWIWELK